MDDEKNQNGNATQVKISVKKENENFYEKKFSFLAISDAKNQMRKCKYIRSLKTCLKKQKEKLLCRIH